VAQMVEMSRNRNKACRKNLTQVEEQTPPQEISQESVQEPAQNEIASPSPAGEARNDEVAGQSFIKNLLAKAGEKIQFNRRFLYNFLYNY